MRNSLNPVRDEKGCVYRGGCEAEKTHFGGGGLDKCHRRHNKGRFVQGHKGFLRLPSAVTFPREKDSAVLFPRRPYCRNLCTNDLLIVPQFLGIFCFVCLRVFVFVRKYLSSCDCTEIRTHVPTSEGFEVTN